MEDFLGELLEAFFGERLEDFLGERLEDFLGELLEDFLGELLEAFFGDILRLPGVARLFFVLLYFGGDGMYVVDSVELVCSVVGSVCSVCSVPVPYPDDSISLVGPWYELSWIS